jgi:hypothetical protein
MVSVTKSVCDNEHEGNRNRQIPESALKRFVTFYITNFPPQASNFFL